MNTRIMRWALLLGVPAIMSLALAQSGGPYELTLSAIGGGGGCQEPIL